MFQAECVEIFCSPFHHCVPYLYSIWRCIFMVFWLVLFSDCPFCRVSDVIGTNWKEDFEENGQLPLIDANYSPSHHPRKGRWFHFNYSCFASLLYFSLLLRMKSGVCVLGDSGNCGCICLSECRLSRTCARLNNDVATETTEQNDPIVLRAVWPSMSWRTWSMCVALMCLPSKTNEKGFTHRPDFDLWHTSRQTSWRQPHY